MKKLISLLLFNFVCSAAQSHTIFIVVHGTWASTTQWCKVEGNFFDALTQSVEPLGYSTLNFTWSGYLDPASRIQAGKDLAKLIESYPHTTIINLVTHSHGSNVGILASHHLKRNNIYNFYALGTPVNTKAYMPNMEHINYFYNLFSLKDMVQPVFGIFQREYPEHERIANIRIMLNGSEPGHSALHAQEIGRYLIEIDESLFYRKQPLIAYFNKKGPPTITYDPEQQKLVELDRLRMAALFTEFCRRKTALQEPQSRP